MLLFLPRGGWANKRTQVAGMKTSRIVVGTLGGASFPLCVSRVSLDLADEIRYSILPILIDEGIPFFDKLSRDVALHLAEVKAYKSGIVELRYDVRASRD